MQHDLNYSSAKDFSNLEQFFSQFSWAFLNFAAEHYLRLDKYWHHLPSWRFSFKHPKGGLACIEVFKEGEKQVRLLAYWWLDDYDQGIRNSRYASETFDVDSIDMLALLNETLNDLISWAANSWTEVTTGMGEPWKNAFSKEQFESFLEEYPVLRPYSTGK